MEFKAARDGKLLETARELLAGTPAGKVKSYLEHGCISVDGEVSTKYDFPVLEGQTVRIAEKGNGGAKAPLEILYEDDYLIAVSKPAGLLSVATDTEKELTAFRLLKEGREDKLFVVHRLDRDTSGVLLFAKSAEIRDRLQAEWADTPKREYLALCEGVFDEKSGSIETNLRETATHFVYSTPGAGQHAVTNYEVIKENRAWSLLRVRLETGRKNQIRVHLSELGHPVAGDKKYGAKQKGIGRLGLHASALTIVHPISRKRLEITAPAPADLRLPKA